MVEYNYEDDYNVDLSFLDEDMYEDELSAYEKWEDDPDDVLYAIDRTIEVLGDLGNIPIDIVMLANAACTKIKAFRRDYVKYISEN